MNDFASIEFGRASAEMESVDTPDLLLRGYLDHEGLTNEAIKGSRFLFLGYKGSGKTALGEHLRLLSNQRHNLFVRPVFLSDFPYKSFRKIVSGESEPESRYPSAWSWLLLVFLLDSFSKDQGAKSAATYDFLRAVESLRKIGILPATTIQEIVLASSKKSFKLRLPAEFGAEVQNTPEPTDDLRLIYVTDHLRQLALSFETRNHHILVIDGLDDILTGRELQFQSLSALITESQRLNIALKQSGVRAKIIVLCRTDVYEKLPGPNKNKIRQDGGVDFDWYHDPRRPRDSKLVTLANLRARLTITGLGDIFETFFPTHIDKIGILYYLLTNTRHTPRDFLQLLVHLQKFWRRGQLTRDQILSGIRDYSIYYFMPEIKDVCPRLKMN